MRVANFTHFRNNLKSELELINTNCEPTIITHKNHQFVVMSKEEFDGWQETAYLLAAPANREALYRSQEQADKGQYAPYDFGDGA